ncbi:hypothetical protein BC834DRAFT_822580 [Gloeopeniophorella convolvens]|nr:hypothetical protein BC834DRAFT_822580 [Gloeopeniophorella convolvens]
MNVLVYATSTAPGLSNTLRSVLSPFYTVQSITPASLATQPWPTSCALLVIPSLDRSAGPLSLPKPAHDAVQQYIATGGRLLGIGLGASLLPSRATQGRFDLWDSGSSTGIVPETPGEAPATQNVPSTLRLQTGAVLSGLRPAGAPFELARGASTAVRARWEEPAGAVAGAQVPVGSGQAGFWDVALDDGADSANAHALLRFALASLGLMLPANAPGAAALPPVPTQPLPQLLLHQRSKGHIVETVLKNLGISAAVLGELKEIKDISDTFEFHVVTAESSARLIADARNAADAGTPPTSDPPRVVIVLPVDVLPSRELTPRFDAEEYFGALEAAKAASDAGVQSGWGLGEALFYSEAVTSTQTMLERNPQFLAALPAPIVSLASFQLAGRGRGSNTWLSPEGCLQFSVLLRAPLSAFPAPRLVFIQYLFGLAVVTACRSPQALGGEQGARVKLKWPNDVYVELPDGNTRKVGGILVNTSFSSGSVDVVVGCGLNVSTPEPIASLTLLSPAGRPLRGEKLLALILVEFERLWTSFVRGKGGWAPFEDAYLDAWMHSDQLVTLTTVDPPRAVRIVGITHDHGLLRTMPERTGWGGKVPQGGDDGYIDVQPDGNSFDIMAGLIRAKK